MTNLSCEKDMVNWSFFSKFENSRKSQYFLENGSLFSDTML